jgi:hypothetical protein
MMLDEIDWKLESVLADRERLLVLWLVRSGVCRSEADFSKHFGDDWAIAPLLESLRSDRFLQRAASGWKLTNSAHLALLPLVVESETVDGLRERPAAETLSTEHASTRKSAAGSSSRTAVGRFKGGGMAEPLSAESLRELAMLDTLGFLEEYEAALYTRSFHYAPSAVQDEIRALQADIATEQSLLSDDEPSSELRERVLERVQRSIEEDASELAPLATIGRTRGDEPFPATRSWQFWRAACFALAASLLVTLYSLQQSFMTAKEIATGQFEGMAVGYSDQVMLKPSAPDGETRGVLQFTRGSRKALLTVIGLPASKKGYELRLLNPDGREITMGGRIHSDGKHIAHAILYGAAFEEYPQPNGRVWKLVDLDVEGVGAGVVLSSA